MAYIPPLRRSARLVSSVSTGTTFDATVVDSAVAVALRKRKAGTDSEPSSVSRVLTSTLSDSKVSRGASNRPSTPPPRKRRGRPAVHEPPTCTEGEPIPTTPTRFRKPVCVESQPTLPATPKTPKTPKTPQPRHPAVNRLANPDSSNATLVSPETSRIVSALPLASLQTPAAQSKTTTENILDEACAHLIRVDPRIKPVIEAHYCKVFSPASLAEKVDPFESLASGIISQQVSGAAARAIKDRFVNLFQREDEQPFPHPSQVAVKSIEELRAAGLSQRKAEYLRGLAEKFVTGELSAQMLADAPYDTLVERLVAVRGLGLWSVEMFAMFALKRTDVFSVGDLGVQRGMAAFAGRDVARLKKAGSTATKKSSKWKYMTDKEMLAMAEPFRPYRSVFMWYMWRVESVDVSTMS
ncbi:3-methyladenine DNA glycosylase [Sporothrix epigloea]|uniref:3-methyladenine DNA glycosylase n=1 Tax=Sporothrix epigloea TaxID=1892477 RepID=A0ABP0DC74_9PEZI